MDLETAERRVVVITGGSAGIGLATADALAADGFEVVLVARGEAPLAEAAARLGERHGRTPVTVSADLSRGDAAAQVVDAVMRAHGRLDVVVNGAGAAPGGSIDELDRQAWQEAFGLKLFGAVDLIREALPHLRAAPSACVVNIAGTAGLQPLADRVVLGAVNAAMLNITRALGTGLARDGIRVCAVVPGPTTTRRFTALLDGIASRENVTREQAREQVLAEIPLACAAGADDVAGTIAFLVSDNARHVTGTYLLVDGGEVRGVQ